MMHRRGWPPGQDREPLPEHVEPMLATPGGLPPATDDEQWAYEMKWDGVRALVRVADGRVAVTSRNHVDVSVAYPELQALGEQVGAIPLLLDGEIVSFDAHGRPSFGRLQKRMHVSHAVAARQLAESEPAVLLIFDVLHVDGRSLLRLPYIERRDLLEGLGLSAPAWRTPPAFVGGGTEVVRVSQEQGLEGVMAKRLTSTYRPGRRSLDWVKIKNIRTQEAVIGGWHPGSGRRAGTIGSLLLGLPGEHGLDYIGKVGTGFTDAELTDLSGRLRQAARTESPFSDVPRADARDAQWVTPRLVGEVAFSEWTTDGRLRHPAWRGLRPDKRTDQVTRDG